MCGPNSTQVPSSTPILAWLAKSLDSFEMTGKQLTLNPSLETCSKKPTGHDTMSGVNACELNVINY